MEERPLLVTTLERDTFLHTEVELEMETKLTRITELAKSNKDMVFTSLAHLLNAENLKQCHHELPGNKANGITGVTKAEYGINLDENIKNLVEKLKKKEGIKTIMKVK